MAKRVAGCKKWLSFQYGGIEWCVYLADPNKVADIQECDGITLPTEGIILIDAEIPDDRKVVVLVHELLHVAFASPQHSSVLPKLLGLKDYNQVSKLEEDLVSFLAAPLTGILKAVFKLRLPRGTR
jgi:hypothetical protein